MSRSCLVMLFSLCLASSAFAQTADSPSLQLSPSEQWLQIQSVISQWAVGMEEARKSMPQMQKQFEKLEKLSADRAKQIDDDKKQIADLNKQVLDLKAAARTCGSAAKPPN